MNSFENDPRLAKMSREKLRFIGQMSDELKTKSRDEVLPFLLAVTAAANERGISFTDEEAELIIEHVMPDATAEDKKRIEQMKMLAKMFS